MKAVPNPNWDPCATIDPTLPPMIAPSTCPAIAPISYFVALLACASAVSEDDVTQFVSHDAGDLAFVLCGFDHSPVDVTSARPEARRR